MIGIYKITNLKNGKVYIGQSVDINRRIKEHFRAGQPDKYATKGERDSKIPIHLAMQKYGIENFKYEILKECSKEELDNLEKYYIEKYDSMNKEKGYNLTSGGQTNIVLKGENHSQAKLTQKEVDEIKYLLKENVLTFNEILKQFPNINSKSTISMINQGHIWHNDNEIYPIRPTCFGSKGDKNPRAKFTEEQVIEMRQLYSEGLTITQIQQKYNHIASNSAIQAILTGRTYKHLPIFKKKENKWI